MDFEKLKKDELINVAKFFGVDIPDGATKKVIAEALVSAEVTKEDDENFFIDAEEAEVAEVKNIEDEDVTPAPVEDEVLVKYERKNPTFEVWGRTFKRDHPFASVPAETAEYLVTNVEGFRLALPSEIIEYYG